jgi:CheY-like chemotaxis protein
MLHRLIGEDIELRVRLSPETGEVKTDPGQIVQVVMNLAVNARDAMPAGGTLTIETRNTEFAGGTDCRGTCVPAGKYVMIAVSDTGAGMDAETQSRIFEPFFTTKLPDRGTGLGLATVCEIVTQSSGYIFLDSAPGQGSSFKVYLPQAEVAVEVPPPAVRTETLRGTETILLVEDAAALREIIYESLEVLGYNVLQAGSGVEALDLAQRHQGPIHLLITDMVMPQMSGPELAQRISASRPETKILHMSGHADSALARVPMLPDATFIQKPFALSSLSQKVREVLLPARG